MDQGARLWLAKARKKYVEQKRAAKGRGIPFLLTFEQWWIIWEQSGKYDKRGKRSGEYQMARFGDRGAYVVGNVHIITVNQNTSEGNAGRPHKNPNPPLPIGTVTTRCIAGEPIVLIKTPAGWVRKSVLDYTALKKQISQEYCYGFRVASIAVLARKHGLSPTTVFKIVRGEAANG